MNKICNKAKIIKVRVCMGFSGSYIIHSSHISTETGTGIRVLELELEFRVLELELELESRVGLSIK